MLATLTAEIDADYDVLCCATGTGTTLAGIAARHDIVLDRVYEAKMVYGLLTRIAEGVFAPGTTVVAVLG